MPDRWCTVTVIDGDGRRHSLDVRGSSTYDAAHLYVVRTKDAAPGRHSVPTLTTAFDVVTDGRVHRVSGAALQRWIEQRRQSW